ncbi:MAG: L-type lectin-domain containing protein [Planctomycetota bacterium]
MLTSLAALATAPAADFDYPDFTSTPSLALIGAAKTSASKLELTPESLWQSGAAWHQDKQNVAGGFATTFEVAMAPTAGADGMAFVLQNDGATALAWCGGSQGYSSGTSSGCLFGANDDLADALVVELDTWQNGEYSDPSNNHVSVHIKHATGELANHANSLGHAEAPFNLNDGVTRTCLIRYDGASGLEVYLDDLSAPLLSVAVDFSALELDDGKAWVGFTGATGGAGETKTIASWSFSEGFVAGEPFGCDLNPEGSLIELGGAPKLGQTWTLGVANPFGHHPPGSFTYLAVAMQPDPTFPPCGTSMPGWGMAPGTAGELLVAGEPPNPVTLLGPVPSLGPGTPTPMAAAFPDDPFLLGTPLYFQGLLIDLGDGGFGLSRGLKASVSF